MADEVPFDIPDSWEWVRHNDLFEISGGSQPPKSKFISEARDGYIRLYQIRDYGNNPVPVYIPISAASKISHKGDILLARYGASLGKVFWAEDGAYNVAMARVIPLYETELISKEFLFLFYQSSLYQSVIHANSRSAQAGFNKEDLSSLFFPLPPRSEQKRIVCAYEKLQPFLNAYDDAAHSLATMNKDFPEALKKSILQEAVQGKLVPQDPSDEPAEALLERIRAEKQRLIKEGKIKKDKHESVIFRRDNSHYEKLNGIERCIDDEIPFDIPENWCWCRFSNVIELQSGQDLTSEKFNDQGDGIPYITGASNIVNENVKINRWTKFGKSFAYKNDLLITCKGTVGSMAFLRVEKAHIARQIMAINSNGSINTLYIKIVLETLVASLKASAKSMIPGISRDDILNSLLPLPPLKEQHRIVATYKSILPALEQL